MTDREKVKKGLYQHCEGSMFDRCGECPYYEVADEPFQCRDALLMDAFELMREQEPVSPICDKGLCVCGKCGNWVYKSDRYCSKCGKAVKWDAAD